MDTGPSADYHVTFGKNGSAKGMNASGISFDEDPACSWTQSPAVHMDLQIPPSRNDMVLTIAAHPFLVPDLVPFQELWVYLNGLMHGFWHIIGPGKFTTPLLRGTLTSRVSRLTLVIPTARSPSALKLSADVRQLGVALSSIYVKSV